jgi:hypothetical protein
VFHHLGLEFHQEALSSFGSLRLEARMGDPTGANAYATLSTEPLDKWKRVLSNPVRKTWCRRYLEWIGGDRLGRMGYDLEVLMRDLHEIPSSPRRVGSDLVRTAYGRASRVGRRASANLLWRGRI